jgi:Fe-S-cluster-containing dehydrogenase component
MSVSRRGLLKGLVLGGAGAALAPAAEALAAEDFTGYPERFGMLTDISKCIGCRVCEAACNAQNELPAPDVPFEDLTVLKERRRTTVDAYTVVNEYAVEGADEPVFRKMQCQHCNEPACVSACFVKALVKTKEGPVLWNKDLCVGCRYCMVACPFNIPCYEYDEPVTPRVMKCTMCFDKFTGGQGAPACAEACPQEAISFGKLSDLLALARERIRKQPDKYVDHIYGENEVGGTSWLYISHVPFDEVGLPTDLGSTPYPKYTKSALAWIPVIVVLWPVLLGGMHAMARRRDRLQARELADAVTKADEAARSETQAKADKSKASALKMAANKAKREQAAAVKKAVEEALEAERNKDAGGDETEEGDA